MQVAYNYRDVLTASERVYWRVEDLIGHGKHLDFTRPFMPESLARTAAVGFLSDDERLVLNQIRGNGYLCLFGLVEEFILPFVLDHARPLLGQDDWRTRALLRFATEEAKHIHLFKQFQADFEAGFGCRCEVIGPASEVAAAVLSHPPLAVALAILHIEWMTQRHFVDSVRDEQQLDPQFKSLLKHHWMEEAQHAKLDAMMVTALAENSTPEDIEEALAGYGAIGAFLDTGLRQQTEFDLQALERATGRAFSAAERECFMTAQHQANRWTYLGSGMTHPNFLAMVGQIKPGADKAIEEMARGFC